MNSTVSCEFKKMSNSLPAVSCEFVQKVEFICEFKKMSNSQPAVRCEFALKVELTAAVNSTVSFEFTKM